jgi:hypothetical protein
MAAPTPRPVPVSAQPQRPAGAPRPPAPKREIIIKRGQLRSPLRHLFYGPGGVGKSTLASDAPNPLFLDIEGGGDNLDIARYPFRDEEGGHVPSSYDEVVAALNDLIANNGRGYQTLVVDTIDALESLIHKHICTLHSKSNVEDFGFSKGLQGRARRLPRVHEAAR